VTIRGVRGGFDSGDVLEVVRTGAEMGRFAQIEERSGHYIDSTQANRLFPREDSRSDETYPHLLRYEMRRAWLSGEAGGGAVTEW